MYYGKNYNFNLNGEMITIWATNMNDAIKRFNQIKNRRTNDK